MIPGLEILNLHAQGGMAEVYRARGVGADGRTWSYAVKRILPELTQEAELRKMFVEEARIASLLIHPNIVRVYDLAKGENDDFFIVMEFLEGRDLAEIIDRAVDKGRMLPVWLSLHITLEMLQSLIYATTQATDHEGMPLGLIHRDISPHNVFVCFDGQVKLTDFGVAKVAQSRLQTQAGITKGKFGYMSPEQLMSEPLDFRSDLYNIGILLYETLTCRRLFHGDNPAQFLHAMLRAEVPPLSPSLCVPPELDALMRRALSKDRSARPATPQAFYDELRAVAEQYGLLASREHLAGELRQIFGEELSHSALVPVPQDLPRRLSSVHAQQPVSESVLRYTPQIVPAQEKSRGLSEPSLELRIDDIADVGAARARAAPMAAGQAMATQPRPLLADPSSSSPPEARRKPTIIAGGNGVKVIRGDDAQPNPSRARGDLTPRPSGSRVVPLPPKSKNR